MAAGCGHGHRHRSQRNAEEGRVTRDTGERSAGDPEGCAQGSRVAGDTSAYSKQLTAAQAGMENAAPGGGRPDEEAGGDVHPLRAADHEPASAGVSAAAGTVRAAAEPRRQRLGDRWRLWLRRQADSVVCRFALAVGCDPPLPPMRRQQGRQRASGYRLTHIAVPDRPVGMEIDGVATLPPPVSRRRRLRPGITPPPGGHEGPGVPPPGMIPPTFGGSKTAMPNTTAPGRALPSARGIVPPGQAGINSRMPREGIVGGRQVAPNTGRPTGLPRGTVIGQEGNGRGPMGRTGTGGMHGGGPMGGAGQNGISGGRRLASEAGGVVGGRPQQPGKNSARPFTPGGSGLVRGANPNSTEGAHPGQAGRAGAIPPGTHGANSRRDEQNGERPDYLSEDEETWQQGGRRVVPPVID